MRWEVLATVALLMLIPMGAVAQDFIFTRAVCSTIADVKVIVLEEDKVNWADTDCHVPPGGFAGTMGEVVDRVVAPDGKTYNIVKLENPMFNSAPPKFPPMFLMWDQPAFFLQLAEDEDA